MSRHDHDRLDDILTSIAAIEQHLTRGTLDDGLVFDAVRVRLIEIGEAVRALPDDLLDTEPELPWRQIAGMRNHLAHQYFDTSHATVAATVREDLPLVEAAVLPMINDANNEKVFEHSATRCALATRVFSLFRDHVLLPKPEVSTAT